ncbi:nucleotidyltransferase family protein [Paenibacillus qinlingensis]|uniref:D-glycero-alpha-D-manno-heptose 1-phosphate guanylyltransferase n=1 Tax=Paenibacillus qinlingensis TaxID=1837343 RepID=A0ABU1NSU4_9BACL|nr:nucleotidyltransferase family protein [Paenibacillus qinlingensis]MDR6550557.1 D-glycero-alpha-D-manno-heptose 1-phosphate guanylyltransferase [Paenibacillus qinlingensis]
MEAIILAGGPGTRLRKVIRDVPKPMAPIQGRPFLSYILERLELQGVRRVVLAVGYKHEIIRSYFGHRWGALQIVYSIEEEPLGTGGACKKAMDHISDKQVLLLNGDTMFHVDIPQLVQYHQDSAADLTLSLKPMKQFDRYGTVTLSSDNRVTSFQEKQMCESGFINAGVYVARADIWCPFKVTAPFSFEQFLQNPGVHALNMYGFPSESYFIDIGIPADYELAKNKLGSRGGDQ